LTSEIIDTLSESVSGTIEQYAQPEVKDMISRLAIKIESDIDGNIKKTEELGFDEDVSLENIHSRSGTNLTEILHNGEVIQTFQSTVQTKLIISIINYLIENHDLISKIEPLPYRPSGIRTIIGKPQENEKIDMSRPKELTDGYYVEGKLNWDKKRIEIKRLANKCDLEVRFAGSLT